MGGWSFGFGIWFFACLFETDLTMETKVALNLLCGLIRPQTKSSLFPKCGLITLTEVRQILNVRDI